MPVFKPPGMGYSIAPWVRGSVHLVPDKKELGENPSYGKIPVPTWSDLRGIFGEREKTPEELGAPPRRDRGGTYTTGALEGLDESLIRDAYDLLLADLMTGYRVKFRPAAEMERMHGRGAFGFEEGNLIELAYDAPHIERLRAGTHELGAKRLRERFGYFDHPAQEDAVTAEGNEVLMEYINRALRMRN